ncbi:proline-rich protein 36-like [Vitis riparia]|uniref:proline-rich protein 36-like n=1 Tax=Vitis riparia TaxID=96939 RepID=UPI00155B30FC|nr:proline-rich protein 36-like [Vitis riparia]
MTAYDVERGAPAAPKHPDRPQPMHTEEPRPVEIPADMRAPAPAMPSIGPMPEVASSAPPATPGTPLVVPATSEPPPPFESRIAISISEFRGLCHTMQTLTATQSILTQQMATIRAHQDQLIATQTQHTAILSQIQQHLGILLPPEHDIPIPSEPTDPS